MPTLVSRRGKRRPRLSTERIRTLSLRMLDALGLEDAELSVLLVDDAIIEVLNHRHRGKGRPTDVLAFPVDDRPVGDTPRILGDVVISLETALRQARSRGRPLLPEVRFLLAHGLLHLVGYDHATRIQKRRMDSATRRLVRAADAPRRARRRASKRRRRS
jgi:probable rRNA maturation factor